MIHMRPYNSFEERNVKFMVDHQIDFTTIQITATGLKKSILDATAPVREYFKANGVHDYETQPQGTEHKRSIDTCILTETSAYPTKTSIYRPSTKKGDPRLWVNKVAGVQFLRADDIFILIWHNECLYAVNLTSTDIAKSYASPIATPLKDLISEISKSKGSVAMELLGLIREKMSDWLPAEVMADTGVGRAVETTLGIPMNSGKGPDYNGIELKSQREMAKSTRNTLFTQVPQWNISRLKSGREIVDKYGYLRDGQNAKMLHVTLSAKAPNPQGLGLLVNQDINLLEADEFSLVRDEHGNFRKLQDVAAWRLSHLHERLLTKHRETFWIDAETRKVNGTEYFRCTEIIHTKNPIPSQFDILLDQGKIVVDFLLCRPGVGGDTYGFRIDKNARPLLFPESDTYSL